jgi:hypothetical protein
VSAQSIFFAGHFDRFAKDFRFHCFLAEYALQLAIWACGAASSFASISGSADRTAINVPSRSSLRQLNN